MGYFIKRILVPFLALGLITCSQQDILFNQVWVNPKGLDDVEFLQLKGPENTSLGGLSLIVVESDTGKQYGKIDKRLDFSQTHKIGQNGYYLIGNCQGLGRNFSVQPDRHIDTNFFENSSITIALVETASLKKDKLTGNEKIVTALALLKGDAISPISSAQKVYSGKQRLAKGAIFQGGWKSRSVFRQAPVSGGRSACDVSFVDIAQIQGLTHRSPFVGERITTQGVVTYTEGNYFWLQQQAPQIAGASMAIKVRLPKDQNVTAGDRIEITARVEEKRYGASLETTQLNPVHKIRILQRRQTLPAAREITRLEFSHIPMSLDYWEQFEGMRVKLRRVRVVGPSDKHGNVTVLNHENLRHDYYDKKYKTLYLSTGGPITYNPERIFLVLKKERLGLGRDITDLQGVVDYRYGRYRILVTEYTLEKDEGNPYSQTPQLRSGFSIASFNLENLFDDKDDPGKNDESSSLTEAQIQIKISALAKIMRDNLRSPSLIVVQEVENQEILQRLANLLAKITGKSYTAASLDNSDRRGIEQGFIWDNDRVQNTALFLGQGGRGREPLVGEFASGGAKLRILAIHLKSKAGDDSPFGRHQPARRQSDQARLQQAQDIRKLMHRLGRDRVYLVVGDFNDIAKLEPGEKHNPISLLTGDGRLLNPPGPPDFSYIYQGNAQKLDYFLVDRRLLGKVVGTESIHVNSPHPHGQRASDHDPVILHMNLNK